jgi:hypothetical protein
VRGTMQNEIHTTLNVDNTHSLAVVRNCRNCKGQSARVRANSAERTTGG